MDEDEEGYDLDSMSEEDKDKLILALTAAYNTTLDLSVTLSNAMAILSRELLEGDVLGKRAETMRFVGIKMAVMNQYAVTMIGVDVEQVEADAKFEEIIRDLNIEEE